MGRSWARLGGENSRSKGFWGRRQANGCFRRCRGEGFCAGGMVARQTAPGCTRSVWTEKRSAKTKRAWAEEPRTGVYVISAWNVKRTWRTGCNRAQGSFLADGKRGDLVGRKGHDAASLFEVAGKEASTKINVGFGGGSGVGPRGDKKGRWETRRCHSWGSGTRSLSVRKRKVWEGIAHLVAWCCDM